MAGVGNQCLLSDGASGQCLGQWDYERPSLAVLLSSLLLAGSVWLGRRKAPPLPALQMLACVCAEMVKVCRHGTGGGWLCTQVVGSRQGWQLFRQQH